MYQPNTATNHKPPRSTTKNFFRLISGGQFLEITKVLRRRTINGLKFMRRVFLKIWRLIYDQPLLLTNRQKRQMGRIMNNHYLVESKTKNRLVVGLIIRDIFTHPKSSAFIRLFGPLTSPAVAKAVDIRLLDSSASLSSDLDICIVQRTALDDLSTAEDLVTRLQASDIKLIVDNDDAFDLMDTSHPEKYSHGQPSIALNYLMKSADQIWLSTKVLRDSAAKINASAVLVPNGLDTRLWHNPKPKKLSRKRAKQLQLLYMGTGTHDQDLRLIMPALDKVAREYPDSFTLTVIGVASILPERIWLRRLHVRRGLTLYPNFVHWFLRRGPFDIGLAPLVDNQFNRSKSDIKCLDYLAAGILPVVSDVEAYKNPELNDYIIRSKNTTESWQTMLSELVSDLEKTRQQIAERTKSAQRNLLTLRSADNIGEKMLEQLLKLTKTKT